MRKGAVALMVVQKDQEQELQQADHRTSRPAEAGTKSIKPEEKRRCGEGSDRFDGQEEPDVAAIGMEEPATDGIQLRFGHRVPIGEHQEAIVNRHADDEKPHQEEGAFQVDFPGWN